MPFDLVPPPGSPAGPIRLGSMCLQPAEQVDIRGGRIVQLRELQAHKADFTDLTAKRATLEALNVSGAVALASTLSVEGAVSLASSLSVTGALTFGAAAGATLSLTGQLTSTLGVGTAPFVVTSTTRVANLNVAAAALADTVTTNANLTGPITSIGNATAVASQTGAGSKFVMDTGPTISALTHTGTLTHSGGRAYFRANGEAYSVAAAYSGAGNFVYFGAADATGSKAQISNTSGTSLAQLDATTNLFAGGVLSQHASTGVGYTTGAGGAVVQAVSKATAVTLNKICGQITTHNAALAAGAVVSFTLNNSTVTVNDTVVVAIGGAITSAAYNISWDTGAGVIVFSIRNVIGAGLSEAIVIRFSVFKSVQA